jgi:hypothetical protein
MSLITFVLLAGCTEPIIKNESLYHWNRNDDEALVYAQQRCGEIDTLKPCVKKFIKTGEQEYSISCMEMTK